MITATGAIHYSCCVQAGQAWREGELKGELQKGVEEDVQDAVQFQVHPVTKFQTLERIYPPPVIGASKQIEWHDGVEAGKVYAHWDRLRNSQQSEGHSSPHPIQFHASNDLGHIAQIAVWGERHSCTNYLVSLLRNWFGHVLQNCGRDACVMEGENRWKHDFLRYAAGSNVSTLHILITKDPYEWVESMQKYPHHGHLSFGMPMKDFLTTEWIGFGNDIFAELKKYGNSKVAIRKAHHIKYNSSKVHLIEGKAWQCSVAPGYPITSRRTKIPPAACLSATRSRKACGSNWLCEEGQQQRWIRSGANWMQELRKLLDIKQPLRYMKYLGNQLHLMKTRQVPLVGEWTEGESLNERDPDTGHRFPSVLALRTAKLRDWMRFQQRVPFAAHVQCRDLALNQTSVLAQLATRFQLPLPQQVDQKDCWYHGGRCVQASPEKAKAEILQGSHSKKLGQDGLEFVNAWLDPDVEAAMGYRLFNTVQEADTAYNAETRCSLHLPPIWRDAECRS